MLRLLTIAFLTASLAPAQDLVGVTWTGSIVRVDPSTGDILQSTSLFPAVQEVNSAARTPDGTWWVGADRGMTLVEIDPLTATVGLSVPTTLDIRGLAVHPVTGEMYAIGIGGDLHIIDTRTGASTLVATVPGSGYQSLAFTSDAKLWTWDITQSGNENGLWEIDPATGALLQHVADPSGNYDRHQFMAPMNDGNFLVGDDELYHVDAATGVETLIGAQGYGFRGADFVLDRGIGDSYCGPAVDNSTGAPARMSVIGDALATTNQVWLGCAALPRNSFGYFLTSETTDFVMNPGGSQGHLCLGGAIGRLSNQIVNAGDGGWVQTSIDLTQVPTPTGPVSVTAGTTRSFSYWYRDANPNTTSNFADGRTVMFQ